MDQNVVEFLAARRIAIAGVSRNTQKMGNAFYKELKQHGYDVVAINPAMSTYEGQPCYAELTAVPGGVEAVLVATKPDATVKVLEQAAALGIKRVWITPGAESPAVLARAKELGLNPVHHKCILMYAEPVGSVHAFHRFFVKLFGQY